MPFIIPNATDTTSGNKYESLDQAEPDSLDFELLGNSKSGVVSGCVVSAQAVPNSTVQVSSGVVVLNGVVHNIASVPSHPLPTAPANNRFDLIVARLSNGNMSITTCYGSDSAENPVFPRSASRIITTSGLPANSFVNPDTDVVLAAVYRSGGAVITNARIVDKRTTVNSGIILQGTSAPGSGLGSNGDIYLKTVIEDADSSGVYVKRNNAWQELAIAGADPGVPVGSVITWVVSANPNPSVWLECNGSAVSRTIYSSLFSLLGTTYGPGDGSTTFNLPDFRGKFIMGLPAGKSLGSNYGSNSVALTVNNLPEHSHPFTGTVQSDGAHAHGVTKYDLSGITRVASGANLQDRVGSTVSTSREGTHSHAMSGSVGNAGNPNASIDITPYHTVVRYFIRCA